MPSLVPSRGPVWQCGPRVPALRTAQWDSTLGGNVQLYRVAPWCWIVTPRKGRSGATRPGAMPMSRSYRLFGILLLVVASLLIAATPAAAASATGRNFTLPAVTRTTYSISGTVRVNSTSVVVPNVAVSATITSGSGSFTSGSANTNASGVYTISHLLPGSYTLHFDPPRSTNLQHGYRTATAPTYFSAKTPVVVTITTASLTGKDVRLLHGFEISGKATRSNGTTYASCSTVPALRSRFRLRQAP